VHEWAKILLGAGVGLAVGLLLEPLKVSIRRRQLRLALYNDLSLIRISLRASAEHYEHGHRLEASRLDLFDHFYNAERTIFYQLDEAYFFLHVYNLIREFAKERAADKAKETLGLILHSIQSEADVGTLDGKLLDSCGKHAVKTRFRKVEKSNRKSWVRMKK
jgi:hypothetical protein